MKHVFGEKIQGHTYQGRKGVYAIVFHPEKDKVLTVRNQSGQYFLPGGGIEGNESHEECLERELMEETGFYVSIGSYLGTARCYFLSRKGDPLLGEGTFYLVELKEKIQEPMEDDHIPVWLDRTDAKRLLVHDHHHWAMEEAWVLRRRSMLR
ncbi:NTP pyrophosphohydrolase [Bacillus sp. AFS015802]|nr:NTP pyrophosphohydrolase [Bacillus sp. AFS015802]